MEHFTMEKRKWTGTGRRSNYWVINCRFSGCVPHGCRHRCSIPQTTPFWAHTDFQISILKVN